MTRDEDAPQLLADDEGSPIAVRRAGGRSRLVLTCEHAGRAVPRRLGDLGVAAAEMERHIAWDLGAAELAVALSDGLDARLVMQRYSRLVVDCNRPLDSHEAIPEVSDGTRVPANAGLSEAGRLARFDAIHTPYHAQVAALIRSVKDEGRGPVLVSVHSFTPELRGLRRPWDIGLLYNRDDRFARAVERALRPLADGYNLAHNEPYSVDDETDYTIPVHGETGGIPHLLIEVRNDHLTRPEMRSQITRLLAVGLRQALEAIGEEEA